MDDYKYIILFFGFVILLIYKSFKNKSKNITVFLENMIVYYKNREIILQNHKNILENELKNEKDKNQKLLHHINNQKDLNKKLQKIINNMLRIYT